MRKTKKTNKLLGVMSSTVCKSSDKIYRLNNHTYFTFKR